MSEKLEPQKRKSIYPPIEITLDGEVFQSRKFTHPLLLEIVPHEKVIEEIKPQKDEPDIDFSKRQWDAHCGWMRIVFGVPIKKMEETDFDEIEDAFATVKTELVNRDGARTEKSVLEMKVVTDKIEKATDAVGRVVKTATEIEKNAKRSGEKQ